MYDLCICKIVVLDSVLFFQIDVFEKTVTHTQLLCSLIQTWHVVQREIQWSR